MMIQRNKFRIGNNPPLDNDLNGDMDEFSLWDRILTAAEITAIYNSGTGEVLSTVQTAGADEKVALLANAPTGTRYEEINTRKIFRKGADLVSGTGLKAYYKMSDADGTTIANTASAVTGNDSIAANVSVGTESGDPTYAVTGTPSGLGNAIDLDGTGDYFTIGSSTTDFKFLHASTNTGTDGLPKFTISWWAKFPSGSNAGDQENARIFDTTLENELNSGVQLWVSAEVTNAWRFAIYRGGGNTSVIMADDSQQANNIASDGDWHHYVYTHDWAANSAALLYYRDASLLKTTARSAGTYGPATPTNDSQGQALRLGTSTNARSPVEAEFCEFSFWSRVLTSAEISKIYNSGAGMQLDTGTTLWKEKGT